MTISENTIVGPISITACNGAVTRLQFLEGSECRSANSADLRILKEAFMQLNLYFSGELREFNIPLMPMGSAFMLKVWRALLRIPYASTASYGDIARLCGNPKAARAVGMANNRNPIPIFIPCHRVIGADGSLVGFGAGLEIKAKLLELESRFALKMRKK